MDPCFFVLGLVRKFEGSSFIFAVFAVRPFFFTGSWLEEMSRQSYLIYMEALYDKNFCFKSKGFIYCSHVQVMNIVSGNVNLQ